MALRKHSIVFMFQINIQFQKYFYSTPKSFFMKKFLFPLLCLFVGFGFGLLLAGKPIGYYSCTSFFKPTEQILGYPFLPVSRAVAKSYIQNYKDFGYQDRVSLWGPWQPIFLEHSMTSVLSSLNQAVIDAGISADSLVLRLYFGAYPEDGITVGNQSGLHKKRKTILAVVAKQVGNYFDDPPQGVDRFTFDLGIPCPEDCNKGRVIPRPDSYQGARIAYEVYGNEKGGACLSDPQKCN